MKKLFRLGLGVALLAILLSFAFVTKVPAAEAKAAPLATSCYGQSFPISFYASAGVWYEFPARSTPYVTSSYCSDINMKFTQLPGPVYVRICFLRTNTCNAWKYYSSINTWYTPATDVLDGTKYVVQFQSVNSGNVYGSIAD